MHLLSPIWLAGLAPWIGAALWLLSGARQRASVPFLPLWQGSPTAPRRERRLRPPPAAVVFALLACLLAIFAAARPQFVGASTSLPDGLVFIVDRGMTMSARGSTNLRFREAASEACAALEHRFAGGPVELIAVPEAGIRSLHLSELAGALESISPTARDTRRALSDIIAAQSNSAAKAIVVITDQPVATGDSRVIRIAPRAVPRDLGITRFALREQPTTQAMVGVRNQSSLASAVLVVSSGGHRAQRTIDLPLSPGERNYFFDLPDLSDAVSAELQGHDDIEADDRAWLVREGTSSRIEARAALPAVVSRMIDAYQRSRPASHTGQSSRVALITDIAQLPPQSPAIVLAQPASEISAQVRADDHAIARHVRWEELPVPVRVAASPPEGWAPVVRAGSAVLVAIDPRPPRRVWVGFDAPQWASSADFVIFWTNVFDWAGGADRPSGFAAHPLADWAPEWKLDGSTGGAWPGIYTRADGARRAFNPPDLLIPNDRSNDWRKQIDALAAGTGGAELAPILLIACMACLTIAALSWRG